MSFGGGDVTRRIDSKALQQALRYHRQHGPLGLAASSLGLIVAGLDPRRVERYLDERSLHRDELLALVPEGRVWHYGSAETIHLDEPLHVGQLPGNFRHRTIERERPFVCELDDVGLFGPPANPRLPDGRYVRDAMALDEIRFLQSVLAERLGAWRRPECPTDRVETGVLMTNFWSRNHYHWQIDILPRLRGVEEYRRECGVTPTLIVGPDPPAWQLEYLDLLGYGPEHRHEFDGEYLHVDTLVVPYGARFVRANLDWLRGRIFDRVPVDAGRYPTKLYVSRDDALCRRVLNEDELVDALAEEGFERVELAGLSTEDQIGTFAGAETVVGPHGAGFANLLYAGDASVLELYGVKEGPSTFNLAGTLGQTYACVRCETRGEDLVADVGAVRRMLERLEAARPGPPVEA